jgi:hypothetical protein
LRGAGEFTVPGDSDSTRGASRVRLVNSRFDEAKDLIRARRAVALVAEDEVVRSNGSSSRLHDFPHSDSSAVSSSEVSAWPDVIPFWKHRDVMLNARPRAVSLQHRPQAADFDVHRPVAHDLRAARLKAADRAASISETRRPEKCFSSGPERWRSTLMEFSAR